MYGINGLYRMFSTRVYVVVINKQANEGVNFNIEPGPENILVTGKLSLSGTQDTY